MRYGSTKRGHELRYTREKCRNDLRPNFLFNRAANDWNSLPDWVIMSRNLVEFKRNLDNFINEF